MCHPDIHIDRPLNIGNNMLLYLMLCTAIRSDNMVHITDNTVILKAVALANY